MRASSICPDTVSEESVRLMTELCSLAAGCLVLMLVELEMVPCLRRGDGSDGVEPWAGGGHWRWW